MKALLDTHGFLWFVGGDARLSTAARQTIEDLYQLRRTLVHPVEEAPAQTGD